MSMASSPPPWASSAKAAIAQPLVSASTLSVADFFLRQRRSARALDIVVFSLPSERPPISTSSSSIGKKSDLAPADADRGESKLEPCPSGRSEETLAVVRIDESPPSISLHRQKTVPSRSRRRGRPSWKRIFFASKKVRSFIILNAITIIYASDIPVLKEVEGIVDPGLFNAVRFAVSAVPFLPFMLKSFGDSRTLSAGLELGFWISFGYITQALGLLTSQAGRASFLSAFMVIVVPLIDSLFGLTVPTVTWFGALFSLLGVAVMEFGGSPTSVGDILNFVSAVSFGIHMHRTEHFSRNIRKDNLLALLGYQVTVIALSSSLWFITKGVSDDSNLFKLASWDWVISFPWIPAIYTGIFSTSLCLWAEMVAMRNVSATETAIIYGLEPVWGAAFAWFLLGERWGASEWIGAALVLGGSLTVQVLGSITEEAKNNAGALSDSTNGSTKRDDLSLSTIRIDSRKIGANHFLEKEKR